MASNGDDFEEDDFTPEEYKAWKRSQKQRTKTVIWEGKRSREFEKMRGSLASLSGVGDTQSVYRSLSKDFVIRHLVNIVKGLLMTVVDTPEDYLSFKDDFIRELNMADPDPSYVDLSKTVSKDAEDLAAPEVVDDADWIDPEGVVTMVDGAVVRQEPPAQKRRREEEDDDDEDYTDPGDDDDDEFDSDFDDSESGGYCFGRYPYWI